ncbi:MAG: class I SAM-dependent methyltransferase [Bacteroidales bacterium]|nr:class I SAM-dependent methyltransferase [Bacteroidales bacterium]
MKSIDRIMLTEPRQWDDYELIDTGDFQKLERFGEYILSRPEPQAVWKKSLSEKEWSDMADAVYTRRKGVQGRLSDEEKGEWKVKNHMREQWKITFPGLGKDMVFRLGLTSFKHIGIFPEQSSNWEYIYNEIKQLPADSSQVLNLFAYTGGASLAGSAAGAKLTHVDSVKQVINWASENAKLSDLGNIRWIIDDALKFVQREQRRGSIYQGIILDPPAYGRGPKGEKWILEENIREMVSTCLSLLDKENGFFLMNLYSVGFSALIAESLVNSEFRDVLNPEAGELYLTDRAGRRLPLGVYYRFKTGRKPN